MIIIWEWRWWCVDMSPLINGQEVDTELDVVGRSLESVGSEVESVVLVQLEQLGRWNIIVIAIVILFLWSSFTINQSSSSMQIADVIMSITTFEAAISRIFLCEIDNNHNFHQYHWHQHEHHNNQQENQPYSSRPAPRCCQHCCRSGANSPPVSLRFYDHSTSLHHQHHICCDEFIILIFLKYKKHYFSESTHL